jgi:hypothetical protein
VIEIKDKNWDHDRGKASGSGSIEIENIGTKIEYRDWNQGSRSKSRIKIEDLRDQD